ncbi:MAG: thioredoxin [Gemmatales bacterium]|nr:MAG: thioredoxin [Gemmatales bacterium]
MVKARVGFGLMAGCLLGFNTHLVQAAPTVAQMLSFQPKQKDVVYSTPTAEEQRSCKVELVSGSKTGANGWLLRDPKGLPLRRYFDSNGNKKVNIWSYYRDGLEVYREIDSDHNEKVDQYRWFNTAGMKWGVDANEDGIIDGWKIISAEEVSQEVLQALIHKDLKRLQALVVSDAEISMLNLTTAEANRLRRLRANIPAKFQKLIAKHADFDHQTKWVRFEGSTPQCIPADQAGTTRDLIKYVHAAILYEHKGKHDFLQLGEMIQVGLAWRIIDAPGDEQDIPTVNPELQKLLDQLRELDASAPAPSDEVDPKVVEHNLARVALIERIIPVDKPQRRELWYRQIAECLNAAVQSSPANDTRALDRLVKLEKLVVSEHPGSSLAAFVTFREMQADYARALSQVKDPKDYPTVQSNWITRLTQFVKEYPKTEETPEALMQLGMVNEFINKETEAKNWYARLVRDFPDHPYARRAAGAVRRLDIEGSPIELRDGSFDIARLRGKLVVVYYWASWNQQYVGDFARLRLLLNNYKSKGLEVVCINLDSQPPAIGSTQPPGIAVLQPEGLEGPLATQYGIMSTPTMFLVGKDGRVISRSLQVGTLEDEIAKYLK